MKRRTWLAVTGLVAIVVLAGCATAVGATLISSGPPLRGDAKEQPSLRLAGAVNDFGLDLLKATTATGTTDNVIVSPASVHAALSMTANGATGQTEQQMRTVLHTQSISPSAANQQWASLLAGLESRSSDQTLKIANALWARKGIAFKKPFIDTDRDFFGAQVTTLDFVKDDVAGAINGWVANNTAGMITHIVNGVDPNAILFLTNAVYFKGEWATAFSPQDTHKQVFTRADGSTVRVDMMNAKEQLPDYAESATLQATRLQYKGGDSVFYVMLPKPGVSLEAAEASLEGTGFSNLSNSMASIKRTLPGTSDEVVLGLPKLDASLSTSLAKPLAAMGMPRAFDQNTAQLSGMADLRAPIYIVDVLHATKVKVDEQGTVAAAATAVEMGARGAATSTRTHTIICNRPYLFAIVDKRSGAMLFLGAVNDPTK